ncbi:hypothetical protein QEH52_19710 [Coraliomargarita sp. SDUM461003]|uniref:Uncharacterized protein n=1 Tax=Thalassobacterium maritimum TaxID=3041265 RepID=A0ABU1B040_9BACT|nr:hypothetical protein [Coraliomargarita sp. SDUM461003]MDQ8209755.1 hypothetical protein [Coraliomargarita sp. SDUM461003]
MKSLFITSILTLLTFQLYAYDSEELNADVNTVAKVISEDSRNSVVLFLVHGDSGISGKKPHGSDDCKKCNQRNEKRRSRA